MRTFYEFFAGGGMARAGLGQDWQCLFANDFDAKKAASYAENWGDEDMIHQDVANLTSDNLPGHADLAWASFPCQDLSLAGAGAGLQGKRSGTFWSFWKLMLQLKEESRAPRMIVLENVSGALTSHEGKDFSAICSALGSAGYQFGAVVANAVDFVPQSRPRLFIIAVDSSIAINSIVTSNGPLMPWHPRTLKEACLKVPQPHQSKWVWWNLPAPPHRQTAFSDLVEETPTGTRWHTEEETKKLLGMMSDLHLEKVKAAQHAGTKKVGTIYKRTRPDGKGGRIQRAEVRFDDVAGCLRTPAGGSSRQVIMVVERDSIRSRLLSTREAARLMGLPDTYKLPEKYNDAYRLAGDGVAV
ncbi:DNA cytosine methyltransferase, partial [Marinobacter sp.]|uniref:DNA cytosine methyltransferase n=1 Tax=Marinobacter sp. TaxID=50741 RepID=UPI0034A15D05